MKKLALSVALASAFASQYAMAFTATPIVFDTNGAAAGGEISVSTFDWSPDNALAVGATPLSASPALTSFELYAQGSLAAFNNSGGTPINGTGLNSSYEITFQAGFGELGSSFGGGAFSSFGLDPSSSLNFFNMYYDTSMNHNQLAGTGYGDGTIIMTAFALTNGTTFGIISYEAGNPTIVPLDGFAGSGNNYPTVGTVVGAGGGALTGSVTWADTDYFKSDFSKFIVDLSFNTSNVTPFNQADPSALVVGYAPVFGDAVGVYTGGVNGLGFGNECAKGGCDFLFQADANQSFQTTVPEPGTLALLGLGLAGLGFSARRRT